MENLCTLPLDSHKFTPDHKYYWIPWPFAWKLFDYLPLQTQPFTRRPSVFNANLVCRNPEPFSNATIFGQLFVNFIKFWSDSKKNGRIILSSKSWQRELNGPYNSICARCVRRRIIIFAVCAFCGWLFIRNLESFFVQLYMWVCVCEWKIGTLN